jgi:hypothetical protein
MQQARVPSRDLVAGLDPLLGCAGEAHVGLDEPYGQKICPTLLCGFYLSDAYILEHPAVSAISDDFTVPSPGRIYRLFASWRGS